ncbi:MAG TPA: hypothetical protein VG937_38560 [Polyangiaceae bacterium]|nr:hypothetical protein [Polyangiaceae bacterium]
MDESRDSIRAEASLPYGGLRVSSSRGGADIWRLGRGVVVIRLFGNGSSAFVKPIASAFTAAVEQGHLVRLFFEVAELVTYDSALRAELTAVFKASRPRIDCFHVLVASQITAMGASVASLALGGIIVSHTQREQFLEQLDKALSASSAVGVSAKALLEPTRESSRPRDIR